MYTDEKDVFIQIQNSIVSSKVLVLVNCLDTFVHDCRWESNPLFLCGPNSLMRGFIDRSWDNYMVLSFTL